MVKKMLGDDNGATAIEYGMIAALVAVMLIGSLTALGHNLSGVFSTVAVKL